MLVQVHTGEEDSKFGVKPDDVLSLVDHINGECPQLQFKGLMGMGKLGDIEGFRMMTALRASLLPQLLENKLMQKESEFELSMGTSADFEQAIEQGATEVRLGTTIFGAREYAEKK